MIQMGLSTAAELLGCPPVQTDLASTGITTDSRQVIPGMLFAALPGETFDGHDYISQAAERGAVAVLVERKAETEVPTLRVDYVLAALGSLARRCGAVLATDGNYNNELGLPLTLFRLKSCDDYAVLEMGASNPGDIAYLANIAKPDVAVITNIGPAHLQGFVDEQGVARAKGELYAALPKNGTAVMNAAEPWLDLWQDINTADNICFFGFSDDNDVSISRGADNEVSIHTPAGKFLLKLPLPGEHNLSNAMAATAVCLALDIPLTDIKDGLEAVKPVPGRLSLVNANSGWTVIDDTYNANPASLYAALQVLANQNGEPWLVLGDMKELGNDSRKMHAELGDAARSLGVKRLFALGDASTATVDAFGERAVHFDSRDGLIKALRAQLKPGVATVHLDGRNQS